MTLNSENLRKLNSLGNIFILYLFILSRQAPSGAPILRDPRLYGEHSIPDFERMKWGAEFHLRLNNHIKTACVVTFARHKEENGNDNIVLNIRLTLKFTSVP